MMKYILPYFDIYTSTIRKQKNRQKKQQTNKNHIWKFHKTKWWCGGTWWAIVGCAMRWHVFPIFFYLWKQKKNPTSLLKMARKTPIFSNKIQWWNEKLCAVFREILFVCEIIYDQFRNENEKPNYTVTYSLLGSRVAMLRAMSM